MAGQGQQERFAAIAARVNEFVRERDWEQFQSPKNLAMALTGEVGELVEHFQWLTEQQSRELSDEPLNAVRTELADVQIYLMLLAQRLGVDLLEAAEEKLAINARKYPVEKARGNARKYTEL